MKELSLRVRGQKDICNLLKKKQRIGRAMRVPIQESEDESDEETDSDEQGNEENGLTAHDMYHEDDDVASVTSIDSFTSQASKITTATRGLTATTALEAVIEDSDDEGIVPVL